MWKNPTCLWMYKKIPDFLKPSRKKFNFEEVDENDSMWKAPTLLPQDKRRIKYAWLVLHDGRLSHSNICDEFINVVQERFTKIMKTYIEMIPEQNENTNAEPTAGDEAQDMPEKQEDSTKQKKVMIQEVEPEADYLLLQEFKSHSMKFLSSIDRFVKLIDDQQVFMELGFEMRNFHGNFTGIQKAYYRVMFRCMEETLVRVMDPKIYRKRIRESMIKFMELVYYNSTFQIDNYTLEEALV